MSTCSNYDIILQVGPNLNSFYCFLNQLMETIPREKCNVIVWNKNNLEVSSKEWENKFLTFVVCNSGEMKLSQLVQNDLILIDGDIILSKNWLENLADFAYATPETATVTPLIVKNDYKFDNTQLTDIGLFDHIWSAEFGIDCLFIKKDIVSLLKDYRLHIFFDDKWDEQLKELVEQFGYHQEVCDKMILYHKSLTSQYKSDYGYPEIFDNIKLHEQLFSKKKKLLYVVQADFSTDASNNIGGTQLHVKDLVFGLNNEFQIFVAARDGEFLRVTAYLDEEQYLFKFYIGAPPQMPIFYDEIQHKLFTIIMNVFSIDLVHVHHTYSLSMEIYEVADSLNIPIILTLHDFYFLCPTVKMFDYKNICCIGNDSKERCGICLPKQTGIKGDLDYIAYWRKKTYNILQRCQKIIVPSENAKSVFIQYFPGITDLIQVIEHGYDMCVGQEVVIEVKSEVHENIEAINQNGQCTEICGWAYYSGINNNAGKIYLEITDVKGIVIKVPTYKIERADVAQGNSNNLKSGFQAFVPNDGIINKDLKYRIIVNNADKYYSSGKTYELNHTISNKTHNLRVAFIGGLSVAKGSRQIYDIIQKDIKGIDWYIFGGIDDEQLKNLKKENLTWTNFYQREDLSIYLDLHKIDIVVILSLWPETFCYTLSEAIACKRPVIVTGIGALGERTKQMKCGWVVQLEQIVPDVVKILENIKSKPDEYKDLCHIVEEIKLRSLQEMNQCYLNLYNEIKCVRLISREYDSRLIYNAWQNKNVFEESQERTISPTEYNMYILKLEQEIRQIYASRSYQFASKISLFWSRLRRWGR